MTQHVGCDSGRGVIGVRAHVGGAARRSTGLPRPASQRAVLRDSEEFRDSFSANQAADGTTVTLEGVQVLHLCK